MVYDSKGRWDSVNGMVHLFTKLCLFSMNHIYECALVVHADHIVNIRQPSLCM